MAIYFTWLKKDEKFSSIMEKMSLNVELDDIEAEFILGCAIVFLKEYRYDKRKTPYFEFAYYIVLKVAINNRYYEPLLDVSASFGLYPISKYILENELNRNSGTLDFALDYRLEKYRNSGIIETFEQKKYRQDIIGSKNKENCYIAPTSFGKSSLIVDIISNSRDLDKVCVIVPTKSLLIQTYKLIKSNFPQDKIIFHDEMYDDSERFISIFTQERALRLLKKNEISFDLLIVDEAHNLFEMSGRSILLTRLIRRNRHLNPNSKTYYLSPLISETGNLKVEDNQEIFERRIISNIKEADIHEYRNDGIVYKYNRFMDEFYKQIECDDAFDYILSNSKNKNFMYLRAPKRVEQLAKRISTILIDNKSDGSLDDLAETISNNVHKDFYCVDYVRKGLIYLHGKLPDLIKEYMEYKFRELPNLKYIIANTVILEGVNLPIDNLFILNTHSLGAKELTNLIGRVNRLNEVFSNENRSLNKLQPSVHFVNSPEFNREGGKMEHKIRLLKKSSFSDKIKNPVLLNFDFDKIRSEVETAKNNNLEQDKIDQIENRLNLSVAIKDREDFLIYGGDDPDEKIKRIFIESGLSLLYRQPDITFNKLEKRIDLFKVSDYWIQSEVIDKVFLFFIDGLENDITRPDFIRLKHPKARAFYKSFTQNQHRMSLKEHISDMLRYFYSIKDRDSGRHFYIGDSYGEISKFNEVTQKYGSRVYVDLSSKNNKELVNISLVKIKIESDFVSYTINDYVNVLYDLDLITEDEYNQHIYGTTKKENSDFVRIGLSGTLINKLDRDGQLGNMKINQFGNIDVNHDFMQYISKQDDLMKFEVNKYIDID